MSKAVPLHMVGKEFGKIMNDFTKKNAKLVAKTIQGMPSDFEGAAGRFYLKVLKVRTGRLRQESRGFLRKVGKGDYEIGLTNKMEYAAIQEEGGYIPPHIIRPKNKLALFWPGAEHPVKSVRHPGAYIRPKKFLSFPMLKEAQTVFDKMMKEIGF